MTTRNLVLGGGLAALCSAPALAQVSFEDKIIHQQDSSVYYGDQISTGDVNGDGEVDIAVADTGWNQVGRGWVLLGPDFQTVLPVTIPNQVMNDFIGIEGAWELTDVTGDGLDDLLMSGSRSFGGDWWVYNRGRALVGVAPTFQTAIELQHPIPGGQVAFGSSMVAHDFTGDGVVDIGVSSPTALGPASQLFAGRIDIYSGSSLSGAPVLTIFPPAPMVNRSWGLEMLVGDYDLDGAVDLLTSDGSGSLNFCWLPAMDPSNPFCWNFQPEPAQGSGANTMVADLDLDGDLDVVTAERDMASQKVLVSFGPQHVNEIVLWQPGGYPLPPSWFGRGLGVGDVDRDGIPDIVVGAPKADAGAETAVGRVAIFYGPSYTTTQEFWGAHPRAEFGYGIQLVDLDGDGFDEILIGAGTEYGGRLHLYHHHPLRILGADEVSLASGGTLSFSLEVGPKSGNNLYAMLIGASGASPGFDIASVAGPLHVNLNPDALTIVGLSLVGTPAFRGFLGTTDALGKATAQLNLPPGLGALSLAGTTLTVTGVTGGAAGFDYATEAVEVFLKP